MSRRMKIFLSILTTIFLGCYLAAGIVLYNSNYKLLNYIDEFPFNYEWDDDGFDFDLDFDFNNAIHYSDSREVSINDTLNNVTINTLSSDVSIQYSSNPNIKIDIRCKSKNTTSFDEILSNYSIENDTLNIATNNSILSQLKHLELIISIPNTYKNNISITTTSGDIEINNCTLNSLSISSTSADIDCSNITATSSKINTTSGEICVSNSTIGNSDIVSTSGDIELSLNDLAEKNNFSSTSGDIELSIPNSIGYLIQFSTISGDLSSHYNFSRDNNVYTYSNGDGNKNINVSTTSGDFDF